MAAGAFGLIIAIEVIWRGWGKLKSAEMIATLMALPAFFILGGCLLATKDTVRRRLEAGHTVGGLSRVFFGMRWGSLILWFVLFLIVGFPLAVWTGNLTW